MTSEGARSSRTWGVRLVILVDGKELEEMPWDRPKTEENQSLGVQPNLYKMKQALSGRGWISTQKQLQI